MVCISDFNFEKKIKVLKVLRGVEGRDVKVPEMCSSFSFAFMYDKFIDDQLFGFFYIFSNGVVSRLRNQFFYYE